jgi:2-polyprenyl-3-methyl-5-hydroxy-6-metoxy-1,4-benzoquinol methylase
MADMGIDLSFHRIGDGLVLDETKELQFDHACFICENVLSERIISFPKFQYYSDSSQSAKRLKLEVYVCSNCGLIQNNPVPTEYTFGVILEEAGKSYGSAPTHMQNQVNHLLEKEIVYPGSTVLDVGCYEGFFLGLLPDYVRSIGIDFDGDAIKRGNINFKAKGNISLIESGFENFQSSSNFDVILMYHVLEHLVNPKLVLANLLKLANQNAALVVEVPILESGITNDINGFIAPLHLTHFSATTLEQMLNASGWTVDERMHLTEYNGYRVVARPSADHKLVLKTNDDGELLSRYLEHDKRNSLEIDKKLDFLSTFPFVVIWGAAIHLELLYQKCQFLANSEAKYLIVDSDTRKWGTSWRGIDVVSPNSISLLETKEFALLIANYSAQDEIFVTAIELGFCTERILRLYENIVSY